MPVSQGLGKLELPSNSASLGGQNLGNLETPAPNVDNTSDAAGLTGTVAGGLNPPVKVRIPACCFHEQSRFKLCALPDKVHLAVKPEVWLQVLGSAQNVGGLDLVLHWSRQLAMEIDLSAVDIALLSSARAQHSILLAQ